LFSGKYWFNSAVGCVTPLGVLRVNGYLPLKSVQDALSGSANLKDSGMDATLTWTFWDKNYAISVAAGGHRVYNKRWGSILEIGSQFKNGIGVKLSHIWAGEHRLLFSIGINNILPQFWGNPHAQLYDVKCYMPLVIDIGHVIPQPRGQNSCHPWDAHPETLNDLAQHNVKPEALNSLNQHNGNSEAVNDLAQHYSLGDPIPTSQGENPENQRVRLSQEEEENLDWLAKNYRVSDSSEPVQAGKRQERPVVFVNLNLDNLSANHPILESPWGNPFSESESSSNNPRS
jgi:hypothetical protein